MDTPTAMGSANTLSFHTSLPVDQISSKPFKAAEAALQVFLNMYSQKLYQDKKIVLIQPMKHFLKGADTNVHK